MAAGFFKTMRQGEIVTSDGIRIRYHHAGAGETSLVFVHGLSCNRSHWDHQIAAFADRYHMVAIDLARHGESTGMRSTWTMEAFAGDVSAVARALGLSRIILIGHSMGGYVLPLAAMQLRPLVIGLIGVDTWTSFDAEMEPPSTTGFQDDFVSAMTTFVRSMFPPDANPDLVTRVLADMLATDPAVVIGIMRDIWTGSRGDLLTSLDIPRTAIGSDYFRPKSAAVAAANGFDLMKMTGVGHFPMMEQPEAFNRLLLAAVTAIDGPAGI